MIRDFLGAYSGAWRYALACPLLFAVPVAVEFVQHVIEMRIGMYDGFAAAQAVEMHPARMGWGLIKTLSLVAALYWTARFLILPGGAARAGRLEPAAVRLFALVMLWSLVWTVALLWGGRWMSAAGLGDQAVAAGIAATLCLFVFDALLAPWKVGAALGNAELGFVRSIQLVGRQIWWAMAFIVLAVLPPMILHYAFFFLAIGAPESAAWAILAVDSLLVGYLGAVIAAVNVAIARRAAARAGLEIAPRSAATA